MIKNSFFKISNLKKILVMLFSLLIVLSVSILIITEVINSQPDNVQTSIDNKFNKIKIQLEFNGLTKTVKEMTKDYSKLFDGFSNIIITNDNGKILYKVNNGYISEKNNFSVIINPWKTTEDINDIAYLLDSKDNIKYSAQLDISRNTNKLKAESSKNVLSKVLFPKKVDSDDSLGTKEITNSDGSSYVNPSDTNIIINYEYIASKGYNLYSLYDSDHQYNSYYIFTNLLTKVRLCLIIPASVLLILFWILLSLWVFKDAQKRHLNAPKWAILTFFINVFGLGIYFIFRPKSLKCSFVIKMFKMIGSYAHIVGRS